MNIENACTVHPITPDHCVERVYKTANKLCSTPVSLVGCIGNRPTLISQIDIRVGPACVYAYATVYDVGRGYVVRRGAGRACGYGYNKRAVAATEALRACGVEFASMHIRPEDALLALGLALGFDRERLLVV